jgi:hypothetical protein
MQVNAAEFRPRYVSLSPVTRARPFDRLRSATRNAKSAPLTSWIVNIEHTHTHEDSVGRTARMDGLTQRASGTSPTVYQQLLARGNYSGARAANSCRRDRETWLLPCLGVFSERQAVEGGEGQDVISQKAIYHTRLIRLGWETLATSRIRSTGRREREGEREREMIINVTSSLCVFVNLLSRRDSTRKY